MSVKYAATSDQKSLMCFVKRGKPSSETFSIIQKKTKKNRKTKATFHFRPAPGPVHLCSAESLWGDLVWKKKNVREICSSLSINSSDALLRDWVVHGARVL